jgi:hypothetical protein
MLIIPFLNRTQDLFLDAYSYQEGEIDAVAFMLRRTIQTFEIANLEPDRMGRFGKRHVINSSAVPRFEERIGIRFQGEGPATAMVIVQPLGTGYRCSEISARGSGTRCLNLSAQDQADATVKCALLASLNHWFGGEAEPGDCMSKRGQFIERFKKQFRL